MRKVLGTLAAVVAAVALAATAAWAGAPGDSVREARLLDYLDKYMLDGTSDVARQDRAFVAEHQDLVVAEANRSCEWLRERPTAPRLDPSGGFSFDTLSRRYVGLPAVPEMTLHSEGRSYVVAGAWEFLCPGVRASRTAPTGIED